MKTSTAAGVAAGIAVFALIGLVSGPAVCSDGWASLSIGLRGACPHHGGVSRKPFLIGMLSGGVIGFGVRTFVRRREEPQAAALSAKERPAVIGGEPAPLASPLPPASEIASSERVQAQLTQRVFKQASAKQIAAKRDCPECGGVLVKRITRAGPRRGKPFLGCSNFPDCKGKRRWPSAA